MILLKLKAIFLFTLKLCILASITFAEEAKEAVTEVGPFKVDSINVDTIDVDVFLPIAPQAFFVALPEAISRSTHIRSLYDITFIHQNNFSPIMGVHGQSEFISMNGYGPNGTRVFFNSRPWRNPRTGLSEIDLMPTLFIDEVEVSGNGEHDGRMANGGVIAFETNIAAIDSPYTVLQYEEGYYKFAPAQFSHVRKLRANTTAAFRGMFPASRGRFPNSELSGLTLMAEFNHLFDSGSSLDFSVISLRNESGIPFTEFHRLRKRLDFDLAYQHLVYDEQSLKYRFYRTQVLDRYYSNREFRSLDFETGLNIAHNFRNFNTSFNIANLNLDEGAVSKSELLEIDFNHTIQLKYDSKKILLNGGFYGYSIERVRPQFSMQVDETVLNDLNYSLILQQSVDPHSPEVIFADYRGGSPMFDIHPVWRNNKTLPVVGNDLAVTVTRSAGLNLSKPMSNNLIFASLLYAIDKDPWYWVIDGDSIITPYAIERRNRFIVNGGFTRIWDEYRFSLSAKGMFRDSSDPSKFLTLFPEPQYTGIWQFGWTKDYWGDAFTGDVWIGGRHYHSFNLISRNENRQVSGAMPLDFQATARIFNFRIYWGLHNMFVSRYEFVPGYPMMHKEEYFGINWTLLN